LCREKRQARRIGVVFVVGALYYPSDRIVEGPPDSTDVGLTRASCHREKRRDLPLAGADSEEIGHGDGGVFEDVVEHSNHFLVNGRDPCHDSQRVLYVFDAGLVDLTRMRRAGDLDGLLNG
jgi:hypothetical protein